MLSARIYFFFFNDTATTEIYTLSLHDALPISLRVAGHLDPLHRRQVLVDLVAQHGEPLLERRELLGHVHRGLARHTLQLLDLALQLEQRTLKVQCMGRHVLTPRSPSPPCGEGES